MMRCFPAILIMMMFFYACKTPSTVKGKRNDTVSVTPPVKKSVHGTWEMVSLFGNDTTWRKRPVLSFDMFSHLFTGNAGCNSISGKFSLDGNRMIFDKNILSTKMACPGYNEKNFISTLLRINTFELSDNYLELSQNNIVLMTLRKINK